MDKITGLPNNFRLLRPPNIPVPWSRLYSSYHEQFLTFAMASGPIRECFRRGWQLPENYGIGIDERCIEYLWYFGVADPTAKKILDAGSALNQRLIVGQPYFKDKQLTILTLAPEPNCFWQLGISYQFGDLRDLPFRDDYFDEIACISTVEHVGMDNTLYTGGTQSTHFCENDLFSALRELNRVLRSGGKLLVTVPFGKYANWGEFQQFDAALLDKAAESFGANNRSESYYYYVADGWKLAEDRKVCRDMQYSRYGLACQWGARQTSQTPEPDMAAAARSVACCIWEK